MTRRQMSAAAALSIAGLVVLTIAIWHYIVLAIAGWIAYRILMHRYAPRRRSRSSISSLGRTAAVMFAAWNSRWLKPQTKASVLAKSGAKHAPGPDEWPTWKGY